MRTASYKLWYSKTKAKWTRRAIARMYNRDPDEAIEHVNVKLDAASRGEERRAQNLEVFAE